MTRFRYKPEYIELVQWFKNGDHPKDGDPNTEGAIVRYYRNPNVSDEELCEYCGHLLEKHGWIDQGILGDDVCPGDWISPEKVNMKVDWEDDRYTVWSAQHVKEQLIED